MRIDAEHLVVTNGAISAITTRDADGKLDVEPFIGIVSLGPEDFEEVPNLELVEVDVCGYCETFPCAQLEGCEPHWVESDDPEEE